MTYVPHYRVSMLGRLGGAAGPEQFSMSFALGNGDAQDVPGLNPNLAVWQDIADDCVAWFTAGLTGIHADAVLQVVKVADIGANGLYRNSPVEIQVGNQPGANASGPRPANQLALVQTLKTAGDLGRVKGRMYVPLPTFGIATDGRLTDGDAELAEGTLQDFVDAINNQPGLDVLDIRMAVASQGRRDKFGTIRVAPSNHLVTSVGVGRVYDTQRRRRNKLSESTDYSPVV